MKLYQKNDVLDCEFYRLPKELFSHPAYRRLSSDAKLTYTLLLDRLSLSMANGWVNDKGEVFLIYTREEIAQELGISYKRAIAVFRELASAGLLQEHRPGRGFPNRIYLAKPTDVPKKKFKNAKKSNSRTVKKEVQDLSFSHPNKTNKIKTKKNHTENSQSIKKGAVNNRPSDRQTDGGYRLNTILENCQLSRFPQEEQMVLRDALEQMYYTDGLRVGKATFPQDMVRSRMHRLDGSILEGVLLTLHNNEKPIKNLTAYVTSVIFNAICEESGLLVTDPYLNSLRKKDPSLPPPSCFDKTSQKPPFAMSV